MTAADSDIRAECKRRFGRFEPGGGCVQIFAADMTTVMRTAECGGNWCPALRRAIEPDKPNEG